MGTIGYLYETRRVSTDQVYVGIKAGDPEDSLGYLGSGTRITNAIRKHGAHEFEKRVLVIGPLQYIIDLEEQIIDDDFLARPDVYNLARGGKVPRPISLSPETRAKISAAKRGVKYGPLSEERKRQLSLAQKGHKFTLEHREKLRQAKLGTTLSPETKAKMSKVRRGKRHREYGPLTPEHRANIGAGLRRYHEQRKKSLPEERRENNAT